MSDETAQRIRNAASVIVIRRLGPGAAGARVLMGCRQAGAIFMANKMVFPGGALDDADHRAAQAFPPPAPLADLLGRRPMRTVGPDVDPNPDPHLGAALAMAALRELSEEAGVAPRGTGQAPGDLPEAWQRYCTRHGPPNADGLEMVFRAVTPPGRPRRFDARFVTMDAAQLADPDDFTGADGELSNLSWLSLAEAEQQDLPFVTRLVLAEIAARLEAPETSREVPFLNHDGVQARLTPL
ncbi:MAG: DNA mismatch repair protein MutT [Pseudomonadota bacterium]